MYNKKRIFYIFNTFIVISILSFTHFTILYFDVVDNIALSILIILIYTLLYSILNRGFIDDIFDINEKLKYKIEKSIHELNTPVATISINSEILQSKLKNSQNLNRLDRIDMACRDILELYKDMEYSIKKEIDNVEIIEFNLEELLYRCLDKFEDLRDNIKIDIDIKPINIKSDKSGFENMITNLISNAIRHNNSITTINIFLKKSILVVQDDGDGISTKDLYRVFDKYFQSDNSVKGFGIGLNMVKEFCDRERLDIKIDSSSDGTTFYINLKNIFVDRRDFE